MFELKSDALRRMPKCVFGLLAIVLTTVGLPSVSRADDLPSPKTGGKNGGPMSVLFVLQSGVNGEIDATVGKELADRGYLVRVVTDRNPLKAEYLKQFNTVVLVGIDDYFGGEYYQPGGLAMIDVAQNVKQLQDYVAGGGGLIVAPIMAQAGSQVAEVMDSVLSPWKMRIGWENVRDAPISLPDPQNPKNMVEYSSTANIVPGELTQGVHSLVYPTIVMRWDDAYSTNPLMPDDPAWQILARGGPASKGERFVGHGNWVDGEAGAAPVLAAARQAGPGRVAVLGIGGYYLFTHAYAEKGDNGKPFSGVGEDSTGPMGGIAYEKGDGKTPSDWGILVDNLLRWTGAAATQAGLGGQPEAIPVQGYLKIADGSTVPSFAMINWASQALPPTWAHHAPNVTYWGSEGFYDEIPDPLVTVPQKMNKILVGAHSAYSDGKGTVAQWAKAAKAAGFSALVFNERFEDFKPEQWPKFVQECQENSSPDFACLQGLDLADTYGNRFTLMGNVNFPARDILTPDGKALVETARLSLGFSQHISGISRPGANTALPTELYRHFQAIPVYTYGDNKGRYGLVDDGMAAYQWQLEDASNPIPIIVHELHSPNQVKKDGTMGYQLIVPSQNALDAVRYFRYGMDHFFEDPARYYISEGPIINGWSVFNKDIGRAELNRDHFRCQVGATSADPKAILKEAVLYDRGEVARRWTPNAASFSTQVDGDHGYQRYYMLEVTDSKGRHAISPHLRTVTRGYFTRCADRQNWYGASGSYTGIWPSGRHGLYYLDPEFPIGKQSESFNDGTGHPLATKLHFPFASNAANFTDLRIDSAYIRPIHYGMDAWRIENVQPSQTYSLDGRIIQWHDMLTGLGDPVKLSFMDATITSRIAAQPSSGLCPVIDRIDPFAYANYCYMQDGKLVQGRLDNRASTLIDLPSGASIGNITLITPLTVSGNGTLGWRADTTKTIPAGTSWHAAYYFAPQTADWRDGLGANGATPWSLNLAQGKLTQTLGTLHIDATDAGASGSLKAAGSLPFLPAVISGLHDNWPAAVWTPDNTAYVFGGFYKPGSLPGSQTGGYLNHIGVFQGNGYAAIPASKDISFYAGNTLMASDPALNLSFTQWDADRAGIEVNNPTDHAITAHIVSPSAIIGKYHVDTTMTVPAGASQRLMLPAK